MNRTFRVHHILCTALYTGLGYSGDFCENMTAIVERLRKNPEEPLLLAAEPDMICEHCPNQTGTGTCSMDENHVVIKDELLLKKLEWKTGEYYTYRQLCRQASHKITREIFEDSCQSCQWYRQGFCTYEKLHSRLRSILAQ